MQVGIATKNTNKLTTDNACNHSAKTLYQILPSIILSTWILLECAMARCYCNPCKVDRMISKLGNSFGVGVCSA